MSRTTLLKKVAVRDSIDGCGGGLGWLRLDPLEWFGTVGLPASSEPLHQLRRRQLWEITKSEHF
jgi:hypothetical protein